MNKATFFSFWKYHKIVDLDYKELEGKGRNLGNTRFNGSVGRWEVANLNVERSFSEERLYDVK